VILIAGVRFVQLLDNDFDMLYFYPSLSNHCPALDNDGQRLDNDWCHTEITEFYHT